MATETNHNPSRPSGIGGVRLYVTRMTDMATSLPSAAHVLEPMTPTSDRGERTTTANTVAWKPATLIAFRFCFVYFGLYVIMTQMFAGFFPIPGFNFPNIGETAPIRALVQFVGEYVLRLPQAIPIHPSGSGDKLYDWCFAFTLLLVAILATAIWTARATNRVNHSSLNKWFRFFIRWAVATTMLSYGFAKVVPLQMPVTSLARLVEPFGDFSMMGVLWYSIGAAPAYEIFVGSAEVFAGVLLFLPRTTMFGAMIALMDSIGILALNLTYDVPVKLFAFHLVLLSLILLAPNVRQLFDLFIMQRAIVPAAEPPLARTDRVQRRVVIGQAIFGAYALLIHAGGSVMSWNSFGDGAPKSPLFGIWSVEESIVDGKEQPPLVTDSTRWRHVILQQPTRAQFQMMNMKVTSLPVAIDTVAKTFTVITPKQLRTDMGISTKVVDTTSIKSVMHYERTTVGQLILDGNLHGRNVQMTLALRPMETFVQKGPRFHWIQEYPVNK